MDNLDENRNAGDSTVIHRRLSGSSPDGSTSSNRSSLSVNTLDSGGSALSEAPKYTIDWSRNKNLYPKLQRRITSCKEALEEALNFLIGSEENSVKPCSKLRAASFVLAYTVHEILGNATRISTSLEESLLIQILTKLDALFSELRHLLNDARTFLKGAHKFSDFCFRFLARNRVQNSSWFVRRRAVRVAKLPSTKQEKFSSGGPFDPGDIVWLLFVQEEAKISEDNTLHTFSQLRKESKLEFLNCLIARYRRLVASAHSRLWKAQKMFSKDLDSKAFLNFSIRRLSEEEMLADNNIFSSNSYREFIQQVLPMARCLTSLSISVTEVTCDAKIIMSLTEKFLLKMRVNLFGRNNLFRTLNQCLESPASVVWRKIEIRLQKFVTFLGVDTMAVVMEKGSLLLRKYPKTLPTIKSSDDPEGSLNDPDDDTNEDGDNIDRLRSPMGGLQPFRELGPGILVDPGGPAAAEEFDLEVNMPEFTQEDVENNNFSGPTLIYLDFSHCPPPPPPEPNTPEDFIATIINNNPAPIQRPESDPEPEEFPPFFLSYHTINFLLLIYSWFSKCHPKKIIMFDDKVKTSVMTKLQAVSAIKSGPKNREKSTTAFKGSINELKPIPDADAAAVQRAAAGNRRKSSVPFADRQAKVRFNRIETMITSTKPGPYKPIIPGTASEEDILKMIHSILKETEHPILIDLTLLSFERPTGKTLSNDEMLLCITMVEWQSKSVAKADRHGRGAIDIISFPTAGDRVEAGSRIKGTLMIIVDLMNQLTGEINLNDPENKTQLEDISKNMTEFLTATEEVYVSGKMFLHRGTTLFNKWSDLLRKKGEFHLEHTKIPTELYGLAQPESSSLFEDNFCTPCKYSYEGALIFFWNTSTMTISSEADSKVRKISKFTQAEKLTILVMLLRHGTELIETTDKMLKETLEVFQEPILQTGFENIKTRVIGMRFDPNSDPLMALDLKNTLSELVQRNCELLNCAERSAEILTALTKIIQLLDRFTRQFLQGVKIKKKKCKGCGFCCRSRDVRFEDLASLLGRIQTSDVLMSMPQPTTYKVPVHDDVSIKDPSDDDKESDSVTSATSTIYRLIQNSEAEMRLLL